MKKVEMQKQLKALCECGHSLHLHTMTFMAPCVGTFGDLKDMDNMRLCECKEFRAMKSSARGKKGE